MNEQMYVIDGESLLRLLTAYFDGDVPLDAKLLGIAVSNNLNNYIGLDVSSTQWPDDTQQGADGSFPLFLRYEGKHNLSWSKASGAPAVWGREGQDFEVPKG